MSDRWPKMFMSRSTHATRARPDEHSGPSNGEIRMSEIELGRKQRIEFGAPALAATSEPAIEIDAVVYNNILLQSSIRIVEAKKRNRGNLARDAANGKHCPPATFVAPPPPEQRLPAARAKVALDDFGANGAAPSAPLTLAGATGKAGAAFPRGRKKNVHRRIVRPRPRLPAAGFCRSRRARHRRRRGDDGKNPRRLCALWF